MLLENISRLVKDPEGAEPPEVDEDFEEEQQLVARLVATAIQVHFFYFYPNCVALA